jgi:hypothetical protein
METPVLESIKDKDNLIEFIKNYKTCRTECLNESMEHKRILFDNPNLSDFEKKQIQYASEMVVLISQINELAYKAAKDLLKSE